jgi:hypothetical protein
MDIEEILGTNTKPGKKTFIVKKSGDIAGGLRLVAILAEIFKEGLYWKAKKNEDIIGIYEFVIAGRTEESLSMSPSFLDIFTKTFVWFKDMEGGADIVQYAEENGMAKYGGDEFQTEEKIERYVQTLKAAEEKENSPSSEGGCNCPTIRIIFSDDLVAENFNRGIK